ncbi:phage portal protein [Lactococcus formosensis subsp. bovis]|uniref:phage portal protein n=1 Tax=Lactococcus formosensis TaxID=1281486 RepID=UPI001BCE332D|nr:phage portal protein [Lactococcus formosensis]
MTSKIISGKAEEIKKGLKKSEVKITKEKELIIKEDGKADQARDLTQLSPPYNLAELRAVTDISDILNQCIEAYATNVAGFGFGVRYLIDDVEETAEMKAEWSTLEALLNELSYERPAKEVIQEAIRHVEECGNGFIEVIRNLRGEVVGIDSIKPEYMTVTKLNKVINSQGQEIKVRYFVFSDSTNDSEVENGTWYKSFGDPTLLDTNGTIGAGTATEVIHLKNGDFQDPYGVPRWIGPLIKIIGNRKADELNYRYFTQGRHVPLAIVLENAELTPESEASLQNYANSVGGEDNQHKFLLLEAEKVSPVVQMIDDDKTKASVRIEKLTDILQQDALFLEYDENVSQAVLGAFRLPPIYVAKTTEYNRSTAETAKELTEEQVFQPLRESYAWRLNDLFKEYGFKYVEAYFKSPNLSNMDDIKAILSPAIQARAVAPNDLRDILSKVLNKPLEDFEGEEYNLPNSTQTVRQGQDLGLLDISKAYGDSESSEIAASIRRLIKEAKNDG